jgi:hypothetical protein
MYVCGSRAADTDREVLEEGSERETDAGRDSVCERVACCCLTVSLPLREGALASFAPD